jgi:predicted transcriptional regulator
LQGRQLYLAQIIATLLQKYALLTQIEIAEVMNKTKSSISKYVSKMNFSNSNKMTIDEKEYFEKYKKIENRIKEIQSN